MTRTLRRVAATVALAGLCCRPAAGDLSQDLHTFALTGTWRAAPGDAKPSWQVGARGLTLAVAPDAPGVYTAERAEPLPDGDWTLSMWVAECRPSLGSLFSFPVALCLGKPGRPGYTEIEFSQATDTTAAVQRLYQASSERPITLKQECRWARTPFVWLLLVRHGKSLIVWVNGAQVPDEPVWAGTAVEPARSPVRLRVATGPTVLFPASVRLASFRVAPGVELPVRRVRGRAFAGWSVRPHAAVPETREMVRRLQSLAADRSLDVNARAYALAALVMARRAANLPMDTATWRSVRQTVIASGTDYRDGLSMLLPVAIAAAGPAHRREAETWVAAFFRPLLVWRPYERRFQSTRPDGQYWSRILQRSVLLDPSLAAQSAGARDGFTDPATEWTALALARAVPAQTLAVWTSLDPARLHELAWYLPQVWATSHNAAELIAEWWLQASPSSDAMRRRAFGGVQGLDLMLSFAAYRMAAVEPSIALRLVEGIAQPNVKGETLDFVIPRLASTGRRDVAERLERELVAAVGSGGPTDAGARPRARIRLARFYLAQRRSTDASRAAAAAISEGAAQKLSASDTWAVARLAADTDHPSAEVWLRLALQAAAQSEQVAGRYGLDDPTVTSIADWLLRRRRTADLARFARAVGGAGVYGRIVLQTVEYESRRDVQKALSLWRTVPQDAGMTDEATTVLAGRLARTDPAAALAVAYCSPFPRGDALVAVARAGTARGAVRQVLINALGNWIARETGGWGGQPHATYPWQGMVLRLVGLPYAVLRDLEPWLREFRGLYAMLLPYGVARSCGFDRDPLWAALRLLVAPSPWSYDIMYRAATLTEAIQAERRAAVWRGRTDELPTKR